MKNIPTILLLFFTMHLYGQISESAIPYSLSLPKTKALAVLPKANLQKLDTAKLLSEDVEYPSPFRYSIINKTVIDVKNGLLTVLPNNEGRIWRYEFSASQASSIQLCFSKFVVPTGAKLFLYNADYSEIYGAFTSANMQADSTFIIADFPSSSLIVEYYEPIHVEFEGQVVVAKIGQAYKDIFNLKSSLSYVNINCSQGADWQDIKHSVCRITFQEGSSGYLCTGTLLNNTNQDETPYFLTANHCISDSTVATTVVAYFNYENEGCSGVEKRLTSLSGAKLLNTISSSDYTLLRLSSIPPASYQPYFAGWDVRGNSVLGAIGIHHPEGLTKKIAIENDSVVPNSSVLKWTGGSDSPISSHWQVSFDDGKTGEGSSGSALFDRSKRIIGQLHGGNDNDDFYGRLSYSFTRGQPNLKKISQYLDPTNSGVLFIDGYSPSTNKPSAFFLSPSDVVCKDAAIALFDKSVLSATSWNWKFEPTSVSFLNGTDAHSQNPVVAFNSLTPYSITLVASNANGSDSLVLQNAIQASNSIQLSVTELPENEICYCKFDSLQFKGNGASDYSWSVGESENRVYFPQHTGQEVVARLVNNAKVDSSFQFNVQLIGKQGTCIDTLTFPYSVIKPVNDDVEQATLLQVGKSKLYSNKCASIQANEPVPPVTSCTGQLSWCDEYADGLNIIENSVWFRFVAPQTGVVGITSDGMDNEMALYQATTSADILSGKAILLAANDDASDTDSNPVLTSVKVTPGTTYWLQVDGSGGGSIGEFTLTLSGSEIQLSDKSIKAENQLLIYPQPVADVLTISGLLQLKGVGKIDIYAMSGKLIYTKEYNFWNNEKEQINVSDLYPGVYLLRVVVKNNVYSIRFCKK